MAKGDRGGQDQGRVKLRVIEFEIDGSNASILESVRSIAATLGRGAAVREPIRRVGAAENGHVTALPQADDESELDDAIVEETIIGSPAPRRRAAKSKPAPLTIVNVDFGKAEIALKDFTQDVELNSIPKKFTIIAVWFKQQLQIDAVDANQMLTAYKHLGWTDMPKQPRSTFHDLVHKDSYKWFGPGESRGTYAVNFIGEQKVDEWRKVK